MRNFLGAAWHKTQMLPDHTKTSSLKFLRKLKVGSRRICPRSLVRRKNLILGALSRLDDFLMNPLIQGHSGTAPETSRNAFSTSQVTNEDDSHSDPHPEVGIFNNQTTQNSGPEDGHDFVTRVQKECLCGHDMVTGVQKESLCGQDMVTRSRERHDMVTGASTSSGKQKRNRSTSQTQFRSENTLAAVEAAQILFAVQQLANNNISANFHNNINRISKLPKSLTTTMPTFDWKSWKFELFEDLFQTSLKTHNQLTEDDRINYFNSLMRGSALQTYKNINGLIRENFGKILGVFRRKYVKPQPMETAEHKFQKIVFNPANQKLVDFFEELEQLARDAFGTAAHAIIGQFIYAKKTPDLKKSKKSDPFADWHV